jgi:hypothetical protein
MTREVDRCYRALELEPGASLEAVKRAWREQVKVWHPDRFPNDAPLQKKAQERLKDINGAYAFLEKYLDSGTPPPGSHSASSQGTHSPQERTSARSASANGRAGPQPSATAAQRPRYHFVPGVRNPPSSRPTRLPSAGAVLVGIGVLLILWWNAEDSPKPSQPPDPPPKTAAPSRFILRDNRLIPVVPVSEALDAKNGFKDFRFGMTPREARAVLPPSGVTERPGAQATTFSYKSTSANRIGEFETDEVSLRFFKERLYRIDLHFSKFQNEIFEAFRLNFGEPYESARWMRGAQPLHCSAWQGERISAAILSIPNQPWDSAVFYDDATKTKAEEYAANEPARAGMDFGKAGFKSLGLGMSLAEVGVPFQVVEEDRVAAVKRVTFKKSDLHRLGFYPLTRVSAQFFEERLYRIDLEFDDHSAEIFETFERRFAPLEEDPTWSANDGKTTSARKLKAKSARRGGMFATVLVSKQSDGRTGLWDKIVLLDPELWRASAQFRADAPKRASKDF